MQISKLTIFKIHIRNLKIIFIKVVETSLINNSPSHKDEQILFFVTKTVIVIYVKNSLPLLTLLCHNLSYKHRGIFSWRSPHAYQR